VCEGETREEETGAHTFVVEEASVGEHEPPLVPLLHSTAGLQEHTAHTHYIFIFIILRSRYFHFLYAFVI